MSPNLAAVFSVHSPRLIRHSACTALLAAGLVSAVLPISDADAQNIVYRRVALTGARMELNNGIVRLGSFGPPAISSSGAIAYRNIIYGQGIDASNADTIIRQRGRSAEVLAQRFTRVRAGFITDGNMLLRKAPYDNRPNNTTDQVTFYFPYYTDFDSQVAIDEAGEVIFSSVTGLAATIVTTVTTGGASTSTPARVNPFVDTLYATVGGIATSAITKDWAYDPNAMNNFELPVNSYGAGNMAFIGTRQVGGAGEVTGIFQGTPFTFNPLAIIDRPVGGLPIGSTFSALELPGINYGGILTTTATVNGPSSALFQGIWTYDSAGEPSLLVGPTTEAPGSDGGTFSTITSRPWQSPTGQFVFTADVADSAELTGGIFVGRMRNDGANRAIPNNLKLLLESDALAPAKTVFSADSVGEVTISNIQQPAINDRGTVVFQGTATGAGIVAGRNDSALWAIVPRAEGVTRTPKPIIRTGDRIRIDGRLQTVGVINFDPVYGLSRNNEVAFSVTFLNARSGVFRAILRPEK